MGRPAACPRAQGAGKSRPRLRAVDNQLRARRDRPADQRRCRSPSRSFCRRVLRRRSTVGATPRPCPPPQERAGALAIQGTSGRTPVFRRAMDRPRPSPRRATPGGSGPIVSFAERARTPLFSPSTPASGAGKRSRAKAPASIRQERRSLTPRAPGVARQGRMMEAQPNEAPALRPRPIRRRRLWLG